MDKDQYLEFLEKYARNQHTREEHLLFLQWFNALSEKDAARVMEEYLRFAERDFASGESRTGELLAQKIETRLDASDRKPAQKTRKHPIWRSLLKYAAAVILLAGTGIYLLFFPEFSEQVVIQTQKAENNVDPGGNKAILTLSDGTNIILDNAVDGTIPEQAGVSISKRADGQLVYRVKPSAAGEGAVLKGRQVFNTITTPKGGQYRVDLPDGTKVWLNAHSSIRFPTVFREGLREVEVTGEAYFEVNHLYEEKAPFRVLSSGQIIEVLGTRFNVCAYADEPLTKTTLVEGSVKVWAKQGEEGRKTPVAWLKPGEQSRIRSSSGEPSFPLEVGKVDVEEAIAWKNGYFKFRNTPLEEIMKRLERWYNIEVTYKGKVPEEQFTGFVSRNVKLSDVLKMLEQGGGVKFGISGRKIEVRNANTAE